MENVKSYIVRLESLGSLESLYSNYLEWEKVYLFGDKINARVYRDPDSYSILFYKDLIKFLNIQENRMFDKNEQFKYEFSLNPFGIKVETNNNRIFYLKSDQLGFSAKGHIYDIYIEKADKREAAIKEVSKWIYFSRSIGGSFLWPMNKKNNVWNTNPTYNKVRGRGKMKDRVDMTLQDIKNCYEKKKDSWLLKQFNGQENMRVWLGHFGEGESGFKKYVEFFYFEPFLQGGNPKDLFNLEEIDFRNDKYKRSFFDYEFKEIETMLIHLNEWINERSVKMEKIIKDSSAEI